MGPIRTVLAATDFSAPARRGVERAFRVCGASGARLGLIHVLSESALDRLRQLLGQQAGSMEDRIRDEARDALSRLAADLGQAQGLSPSIHLASGAVLGEILGYADAIDASLVVVGARGEGFLRRLLLGATAERLLRKSLRPMLVVKQTPHEAYRRVLVPVDFSAWSVGALRIARTVAPKAEVVLLHAFEVPFERTLRLAGVDDAMVHAYRRAAREEALAQLRELAARCGFSLGEAVLAAHHGDASRIILEQEQEQDCDLIVMGKHGKGVLEELLLGSVTKHVLAEAGGDVLVAASAE